MAPLSLFRLKKHQQRRVVEPRSPDSFFSPGRSRTPSIIDDTVDIVPFEPELELAPAPTPEPEPEHEPEPELQQREQQRLEPSVTDEGREREPPSMPVSACATSFVHSISPGPPTLALSLRFSFDAEGSLGDSIERYFLSSHPRADPSTPEPTAIAPARADRGTSTSTTVPPQPTLTKNSIARHGPIIPTRPASITGFDSSSITAERRHPHNPHQQQQPEQPNTTHSHPRRSPNSTNLSHRISDDRSFHDSPVLHPQYAADDVLDISPSASRIDLLSASNKSTNSPAPLLPISIPELPELPLPPTPPPPVPPRPATGHVPRKRSTPAPIKIPTGSVHSPRVILDRAPADRSTLVPPSVPAAVAVPAQRPQARRNRSTAEIEHVEHARSDGFPKATTTTRLSAAVARSRTSTTASAYFAAEYDLAQEYALPPSSEGDRLSVVAPPPGWADSATLPQESPWPARGFFEEGNRHAQPVLALPTLPPVLRRTRTIGNGNRNGNEDATNRMLMVPKRESSLLASAITAKLLPTTLRRRSGFSPTSAPEAASSWTFSQSISGHQNPSVPQDAVALDSAERKSIGSEDEKSHTTTASTGSEAEAEITIAGYSSGVGLPVAMTPAGILGLQKSAPNTAPSNTSSVSQPTTAPSVLHLASPPRNKTEDTDTPDARPLRRDASYQHIGASAHSSEAPWQSLRRTDSLRPSPVVERLKASRDSAQVPLPPAPGTALAQYLDQYANTNTNAEEDERGEDKEGTDGPASASSSSLFGTSATGRSPYSLYQGTTPDSGKFNSSAAAPSKVLSAATASTPTAAPPNEQTSSSSSKPAPPYAVSRVLNGTHGHFRGRSVSDAPPASAFVPTSFDRRPSAPESSSTPSASTTEQMENLISSTKSPKTASSLSSNESGRAGVLPVTMMERSEVSLKPEERVRPVRPALNTNAPPPMKDLREDMFPHTPHSFSPAPHSTLEELLGDATRLPVAAAPAAAPVAPPPTVVAPEFTPARPSTAEAGTPALGGTLLRSFPSHRAQMSSSSSTSSFSRRDRTLPIGPRKPTIKRKGAEYTEIPRPVTAPTAGTGNLPTPAMTPPGQASRSNQREGSISISPPQAHSRTWTKSSTSTSASASVMEKIDRPTTPTFDTVQVQWRGLTLDAARWIFSSQELQAMVGRAIRQSADPMSVRLVPLDLLDTDLPVALEDLEVRREEIKAKYSYQVRRRRTLMRELAGSAEGTATPGSVLRLVEDLLECVGSCDRLSEELFMVSDQIAQIGRLRDGHSASALAMALRKINTSFLRATGEAAELKTQVEALTAEREEAWAMAETVENELDELRAKMEVLEQATLGQQHQRHQRQALQVVTNPVSRTNSTKGSLSRSTSRVSAARKSSMRVSKASLRSKSIRSSTASTTSWRFSTAVGKTPATSSPLFLAPPVPRIPRSSARNSYSADGYSPSPRGTPQSLIDVQNELLEMLGVPINEFKNGSFIPPHRRSHSVTVLSWTKSPPASPLDSQPPPVSPVPIPKAPPASKLFRSASIAEHARLSRRKREAYSTVDLEMIYDGILDDPETLFAVLKK